MERFIEVIEHGRVFHIAQVKDLRKGTLFSRVPFAVDEVAQERHVLVCGFYERSLSRYECYYFADVNKEAFVKGSKFVYVDFLF